LNKLLLALQAGHFCCAAHGPGSPYLINTESCYPNTDTLLLTNASGSRATGRVISRVCMCFCLCVHAIKNGLSYQHQTWQTYSA